MSKGKIALVSMSAAGALAANLLISPWEGRVYIPYKDIGGVVTVCDGHTGKDIIWGKVYTDEECDVLLAKDTNKHEAGLDRCLARPELLTPHTKGAVISYTYNVGVGAACRSTLVKKVNAGDIRGACDELSRWVFVNGRKIKGLENRRTHGDRFRISERTLCLIGLDPAYKTPLYEKLYTSFKDWRTHYGL